MSSRPTAVPTGVTWSLVGSAMAAIIGSSVPFGYNIAITNVPGKVIDAWAYGLRNTTGKETSPELSNINAAMPIGAIFGALVSGWLADRMGSRMALLLSNFFTLMAVMICPFSKRAKSALPLIAGRVFAGIHAGLGSSICPMFLVEISPPWLRGPVCGVNNAMAVTAILVGQTLGLPMLLGSKDLWIFLFVLPGFFALAQIAGLFCCPDAPVAAEQNDVEMSWSKLLRPPHRYFVAVVVILMFIQQLTGINAVMSYSTTILEATKMAPIDAQLATLGVGAANLVATIIQALLVNKFGRKTLLMGSLMGMLVATYALILCLNAEGAEIGAIVALVAYIFTFALGAGGIPWLLPSEMFEGSARAKVCALVATTNWVMTTVIMYATPMLMKSLDQLAFVVFAVGIWLGIFFSLVFVRETKGKTPAQICA